MTPLASPTPAPNAPRRCRLWPSFRARPGNTFYEHIICDGIDGEPTLENCAVLTRTCWHLKTNSYDKPIVAKARRVGDRHRNIKPYVARPLPGRRDSNIRIRMSGPVRVVDRRTGQPWRWG